MSIERNKMLPDSTAMSSLTVQRKAALTVCGNSTDVDDAAQLLDMLGLRESPDVMVPSVAELRRSDHQRNGG